MAKFPKARWRGPIPNKTTNGMGKPRFLILHIEEGTETGTGAWFHNRKAEASSHFGNPRQGPLDQWVSPPDKAWAEAGGNPYCISVENEGHSGDRLNANQIENVAQLLAWCNAVYGVRMRISNHPSSPLGGVGWHGMGGIAWGNHTSCPGKPIVSQRKVIIKRAKQIRKSRKH